MPALKLPALKPSHTNSLVSPANEAAAIWISDDGRDDGSEPGTEDDPGGDVSVDMDDVHGSSPRGDDAGDHDADRDEGHDDLDKHERDADDDGESHAQGNGFASDNDTDTGDNNPTVRVASSRGKRDGCDAAPATPGGAVLC